MPFNGGLILHCCVLKSLWNKPCMGVLCRGVVGVQLSKDRQAPTLQGKIVGTSDPGCLVRTQGLIG